MAKNNDRCGVNTMEVLTGFPGGSSGKEPACSAGDKRCRFHPWVGKIS